MFINCVVSSSAVLLHQRKMIPAGIYEKGSAPIIVSMLSIGNNDGLFVKVLQRNTLPCEIEAMRTSFYHDPGVVVS